MIIVYVHHLLNEAGQQYFPTWLQLIADKVRQYEGFISVRQLIAIEHPEQCHLLLEFESLPLLRRWASSPTHDEVVALLDPFRTGPAQATIFEAKPSMSRNN